MQGKGALIGVNVTTGLFSTILLAKLIVDLVNKKKKVEEIYLELVCTIGIFLLCLVATVLLIKGKKERKKIERSDSSLSLDNSDEEVEKIEERQPLLKRSASCPGQLNNKTTSAEEVRDAAKRIENTMVKGDTSKTDNYYNLTDQQTTIKHFGRDESIIAVTFPESYSIKKLRKIDADKEETIQNTKNSIIDDGDKYKPVDFRVNKIKTTNDKGKKGDSYQFTFKFQSVQKDDVFIEVNCSTLNVYSGWQENKQKPVTQYFKDLKANDDFLIFLDVNEIFTGLLGKVLTFAQKVFPANDQGLSPVTGQDAYKHFELKLLQEKSSYYIDAKGKGILRLLNKKFPIKDILVNDQLIHKEQKVKQGYQNNVDQDIQVDGPTDQNVTTSKEISNIPQSQNKEDETNLQNVNPVSPSSSTSNDIGSDRTSISDIATTESKEKSAQKQSVSRSSSRSFSGSKESVDSAGKPKKKFSLKSGLKSLRQGVSEAGEKIGSKLEKVKNKLKKDKNIKSNEVSPSSSIDIPKTESVDGINNQGFVKE
ncbi:hypothetical protein [Candidatus Mesenet endosymbiont of Agriotes lineatus]|uniref:hypothetical protein n=1 Tax=Candidatus Mesenet endosymbiont of Agriotes lineatus TaxID=3077948 RepID=UPI0030CCAE6A